MSNILKNLNNVVLKSNDKWAYFKGGVSIPNVGAASNFNYIHQTGVFAFECDVIISNFTHYNLIFANRLIGGGSGQGIIVYNQWGNSQTDFLVLIGNGSSLIMNYNRTNFFSFGVKFKLKIISNGVRIWVYKDNVLIPTNAAGSSEYYTGSFGTGSSAFNPYIGGNIQDAMTGYLRNMKFYNSPNTSQLLYHFPLQDSANISKDIVGGLQGTSTANISIYDFSNKILTN